MTLTTLPTGIVPEDYERIKAAVMETARGRWFLLEFARRQRSAETATLLEAIERLENRVAEFAPAPAHAASPAFQETEKRFETPAPVTPTPHTQAKPPAPVDPRLSALSRLDHLPLEDKLSLFS